MQNKGAITVFAILLALASIYQLSFTVVSSNVKYEAKKYALGKYYETTLPKTVVGEARQDMVEVFKDTVSADYETVADGTVVAKHETAYLDSVASKEAYPLLGFTFKECQKRELNLGLDLKGGMNVIMEVSVSSLIKGLSENSDDPKFNEALELAKEKQKSSQEDFITLFEQAFNEVAPEHSLSSIFNTQDLKGKISYDSSDEDVIEVLREQAESAIDNSLNIIRSRIDRFGVVQPTIQKLDGYSGRILVELPGIKEPERVRKLLQGTADLQFWETYYYTEVYEFFLDADKKYAEILKAKSGNQTAEKDTVGETTETDTIPESNSDTALSPSDDTASLLDSDTSGLFSNDTTEEDGGLFDTDTLQDESESENPLFQILNPAFNREGRPVESAAVGWAHQKDTAEVNEVLAMKKIRAIFPRDLRFAWEVKPFDENEQLYQLVALKEDRNGPSLEGNVITNARQETDNTTGEWQVSMTMNSRGTSDWARITKDNIGRQIAIVLDGYVYSYPVVRNQITGGSSSISGDFTSEEATDLANILKSGKLPAPAIIIEEAIVGPSLGREAVNAGLTSFVIAFIFVLVYMVLFYRSAGIVSDIALIANVFFIFGVLASLGAVLTLPGIAGIILTIGMSVDANVLIYERIKEEMAVGKGLKLAVKDGYKNAYSAIIDANLTTLITGIILYVFGHGPIKGFATTLIIGILTSLFSAIFITRLIFIALLDKNKEVSFFNKFTKNALKNTSVNFIVKRKVAYIISGIIIAAGLVSLFTNGLNLGVDFKGGRTYVVRFDKDVRVSNIAQSLKESFGEAPEVKIYGESNQVKIVTKYLIDSKEPEADERVETKLFEGLKSVIDKEINKEQFLKEYRQSSQKVGPTIADDIKIAAIWAILFSLLAIFLYVFSRFRNWQFGLGAVTALSHDVLVVLGLYSLLYSIMPFSMEIDQAFIAAILTLVGYSVNDTVVVFDRIREYLKLSKNKDRTQTYNDALNSTISRTFNTSITTFIVLLAIFIFGGEVIRGFIFALLIGVVVGTYSSLFIATPVVFDTVGRKEEKLKAKDGPKNRDYKGKKKKKKKKKK